MSVFDAEKIWSQNFPKFELFGFFGIKSEINQLPANQATRFEFWEN